MLIVQSTHTMNQIITPELRQWLQDQAADGHSRQSVLDALLKAGWEPDTAALALDREWAEQQRQRTADGAAAARLPAQRLPDLDLARSPRQVDAGDRRVDVIAMLAALHPLAVVVASVFVAGMLVGADSMSRAVGVPTFIADVIVAASLISVLVATLLTQYRVRWK